MSNEEIPTFLGCFQWEVTEKKFSLERTIWIGYLLTKEWFMAWTPLGLNTSWEVADLKICHKKMECFLGKVFDEEMFGLSHIGVWRFKDYFGEKIISISQDKSEHGYNGSNLIIIRTF